MRKVYLAGPDVFLPNAIEIGDRKKLLCRRYGFEGLFPFDNEIDPKAKTDRADRLIYRANEQMMHKADLGIFNLTPFRGPSADVGTVFELGFMVGLKKRVFGYTNNSKNYAERVIEFCGEGKPTIYGKSDSNNMTIEPFGNIDNLMIDWAIAEHGGRKIEKPSNNVTSSFEDLSAFEACLRHAAQAIAKSA